MVHCDDIGYLFKNMATPKIRPGSKEDILLKKVIKLWTNFAKFGNPTPDHELGVLWKTVINREVDYLDIGNNLISSTKSLEYKRIQFLMNLYDRRNSVDKLESAHL